MRIKVFHSVNAGLFLSDGKRVLMIDGVHEGERVGLSPMPHQLQEQLASGSGLFSNLSGALFTHWHPDHFSLDKFSILQSGSNAPLFYGPDNKSSNLNVYALRNGLYSFKIDGIKILAQKTIHDGEVYFNEPHQSYLIQMCNDAVFVAGDAILDRQKALNFRFYNENKVTAAFFNLFQISSPQGQAFIKEIKPQRVFLYHRPYLQHDKYNYCVMARQAIKKYPPELPNLEVLDYMSWIDNDAPKWSEIKL